MKAFEALARLGFGRRTPGGTPGPIGRSSGPFVDATTGDAVDAELGQDWRNLLSAKALYHAWAPPPSSPWSGYAKPTLFAALDGTDLALPQPWPRLPQQGAPRSRVALAERTAVVLDLPGAWSVAVGAWLARAAGLQPVVMANNWPHPRGVVRMQDMLAALLYYAPWVTQDAALRGDSALPVFVLDRDRLGHHIVSYGDFDNRYYLQETDFPSPAALKRGGVDRLLYVSPEPAWAAAPAASSQSALDMQQAMAEEQRLRSEQPPGWEGQAEAARERAEDARLRALVERMPDPGPSSAPPEMDDLNAWLVGARRVLGVDVALADVDEWKLKDLREYAPAPRKTVFNTVKDPAFRGFRRAAAGGFGRLVPEPSSGAGGVAFG